MSVDFLTGREISGIRQDKMAGDARQESLKHVYGEKLKGGLGEEMLDALENPGTQRVDKRVAKRLNRIKRRETWRANLKRIFGLS